MIAQTGDGAGTALAREILRAVRFAAEKHSPQRRKGRDEQPYINHPIEVAELLARCLPELDPVLIVGALLHDTVEDTDATREDIASLFGEDVATLVMEVTDDKSLPKERRKQLQVERAPNKSVRAQNLSTSDKTSNLLSIVTSPPKMWSLERKVQYFEWAKSVVDRLDKVHPALRAEFDKAYSLKPQRPA